jgi:hypothetical protein
MCDPTAALFLAVGATAAGKLVGGMQERRVASANAAQLRQDARIEAATGAVRDQQVRRAYRQQAGLQRAQLGAAGVTLDSASSLDLGRDLAAQGALDSWSARLDSTARQTRLGNQARLAKAEGTMAMMRGGADAAGTVLTAAPRLWPGLMGAG